MPSCVFKHCKSCSQTEKKEHGVSFHRLPTDVTIRGEWISIIRQSRQDSNWQPSNFCVVCSLHFKDDDVYSSKTGRRLVKKTSKPTQNLSLSANSNDTDDSNDPLSLQIQAGPDQNSLNVNKVSGTSNQDNLIETKIRDSDLNSILVTFENSQLKKDLRKQKLLRVITKKKLKLLQQKNRRLAKRNVSLKNILMKLKDRNLINYGTHNLLSQNIIAIELLHNLYRRGSGKKKIQYSPTVKKFCLSLNSLSTKAYDYVRKSFDSCLPHPKTLQKWYTHVESEPGFTEEASTSNTSQRMVENSTD